MNTMLLAIILFVVSCVGAGLCLAYVKLFPVVRFSVRFAPSVDELLLRKEREADSKVVLELGAKRVRSFDETRDFRAAAARLNQDDAERLALIAESLSTAK